MYYYSPSTLGFYITEIHGENIPEGSIIISKDEYSHLIAGKSDGKSIAVGVDGNLYLEEPEGPTFQELKYEKLLENNRLYEEAVNSHTASYPQAEKDTWPTQDREIKAWQADPENASTPWIDAAASIRGIEREDYLQRTLQKTQQFEQLSAYLTGLRQRYEDQIKSSKNSDELGEITIDYNLPV
jgi:phage pi2 protein 07